MWSIPLATPNNSSNALGVEVKFPELLPGKYNVILYENTIHNCYDSIIQTVSINNDFTIYAPNTFTPDGDAFNNSWRVHLVGLDIYDFHLMIFNRYGEIIWESFDPSLAWNGTYSMGTIVPNGIYVWKIIGNDSASDAKYFFDGFINVMR